MERESKMKGWSRDMEEEKGRARDRARKYQDANLSPLQIWGGGPWLSWACLPPTPGLEDSMSLAQFLSCMSSD